MTRMWLFVILIATSCVFRGGVDGKSVLFRLFPDFEGKLKFNLLFLFLPALC